MGAHSTLMITRSKAKAFIINKVTNGLSDKEIESIMDSMLYDRLYNCMIVPDSMENGVFSNENDDHMI